MLAVNLNNLKLDLFARHILTKVDWEIHDDRCVGLIGANGAGKSSLTDEIVRRFLLDDPELRIAVLSVDPTRRRSGGALLGDRIRMNAINPWSKGPRVFMRSLATREAGNELSQALPEVPTMAEAGVAGYEFTGWMGVLAPAATPRAIVDRLHREIARIVHLPEVKQRFTIDAADPVGSTPEAFSAYLKAEVARWTRVAKEAGITVD